MRLLTLCGVCLIGIGISPVGLIAEDDALSSRYLPYAPDATDAVKSDLAKLPKLERYWRTAEEIKAARSADALPLEGLRLVIDPGHIGGQWADVEARNFRVSESDFWIREGELVLEVALDVKDQLEGLGADVFLTRTRNEPLSTQPASAFISEAIEGMDVPVDSDSESMSLFNELVLKKATQMAAVRGELLARADWINDEIQPDAVLSLHIDAAPWPKSDLHELVPNNHLHVLIFGCLSKAELLAPFQTFDLLVKLQNGSGGEESELGEAMARALKEATGLPAFTYEGENAVLLPNTEGYLWARNLLLLRKVQCPIALLEPYVANSEGVYLRLQEAIRDRKMGMDLSESDLLKEYAEAVVAGVIDHYASSK